MLSEAAEIARAAARQLIDARNQILDGVADAEAAGFRVQEDFSVRNFISPNARSPRADRHAAAIRAAVSNYNVLDRRVSSRLRSAANALQNLNGN